MSRLLFTLALAVVAWVISLITGGGRRQVAKIPEGMGILCQPPGKRYVLYALGVVVASPFSASCISWTERRRRRGPCGPCVSQRPS